MATLKQKDKYGQIEPNRCSFLHDGNIESQCKATVDIENGAIVEVDKVAGTVAPVTGDFKPKAGKVLGVCYTAERIYDERTPGRKNFVTKAGEYPRVGYLKAGDVFTTNVMLTEATVAVTPGQFWVKPTGASAFGVADVGAALQLQVARVDLGTADGQDAVTIQVM